MTQNNGIFDVQTIIFKETIFESSFYVTPGPGPVLMSPYSVCPEQCFRCRTTLPTWLLALAAFSTIAPICRCATSFPVIIISLLCSSTSILVDQGHHRSPHKMKNIPSPLSSPLVQTGQLPHSDHEDESPYMFVTGPRPMNMVA